MLKVLGALAAMISSLSGQAGPSGGREPIRIIAEPADGGVRVRVVGSASAPYAASFSLEVTSRANRSVHRGSANLAGGESVTLSTVTLGNSPPGEWRAHLRVEPEGGEAYEEIRTSF